MRAHKSRQHNGCSMLNIPIISSSAIIPFHFIPRRRLFGWTVFFFLMYHHIQRSNRIQTEKGANATRQMIALPVLWITQQNEWGEVINDHLFFFFFSSLSSFLSPLDCFRRWMLNDYSQYAQIRSTFGNNDGKKTHSNHKFGLNWYGRKNTSDWLPVASCQWLPIGFQLDFGLFLLCLQTMRYLNIQWIVGFRTTAQHEITLILD